MSQADKIELISFKLCPFVQRSIITLLYKNVPFNINYINLNDPPDWFKVISPLGKVPVLKTAGEVLFESAVINEYIDEITLPSLHPADPLRKAHNRAWIEFSSTLIMDQFTLYTATEQETQQQAWQHCRDKLKQIEPMVIGPFFNGTDFSLVDAAWAPIFMRLSLITPHLSQPLTDDLPNVQQWILQLSELTAVKHSVVLDFPELFMQMLKMRGSLLAA
jgi:glutathione S-transferase